MDFQKVEIYWTCHYTWQSNFGRAVSDSPKRIFTNSCGTNLITNCMIKFTTHFKADVEPNVMIDDNGQACLFWGNRVCYYSEIEADMIQLYRNIKLVKPPRFTEEP